MKEELVRPKTENNIIELMKKVRKNNYEDDNELRIFHHMERYELVAQNIDKKKENYIIDIGCGLGVGLDYIHSLLFCECCNRYRDNNYFGMDIDGSAVKEMHQKFSYINPINGNIKNWGFPNKFDILIYFEVLGNESMENDEEALNNIKNMCNIGGKIFISIPNYGDYEPKAYFNRIYDPESFTQTINKIFEDENFDKQFLVQKHPFNREDLSKNGIYEGNLSESDFMICIIEKRR
jgi:2-polyprenyl-3-methyl-5-hydroxy-6-metoxy-1,4-benzoquinol methylase